MTTRSGTTQTPQTARQAPNARRVQQVLGEVFGSGDVGALEKVLADGFVHRRPDGTTSDKTQWIEAVRETMSGAGAVQVEVEHLIAEGDLVVMHSRRRAPGGRSITGVDIWRFDDGRIAEAWEILEPAQESAAHLRWWAPAAD